MSPFLSIFGKKSQESKKNDEPAAIEQKEMIEGVENLSETTVKEVMVPRTDTMFIASDASLDEVFTTLVESGHSRIPVYKESIDNVVGILYAKDVMAALIHKQEINVLTLARKPFFVPETKRIDSLLREFKRRRVHIAVVLDEYGGTSGIVCMEDIIEEIVGEIQDEYDDEAEDITQIGPQAWLCDARVHLDEVSEKLDIDLTAGEFDSLAGYVFDLFGRIPTENESISTEEAIFTIQTMEAYRILSVKIEKVMRVDKETSDDDSAQRSQL
ncbi:MAG TPA: hemolysin family protein [Rectinemataceae bacterium]|nr:hemolysin family protein [Rectinemataceae bacterium]